MLRCRRARLMAAIASCHRPNRLQRQEKCEEHEDEAVHGAQYTAGGYCPRCLRGLDGRDRRAAYVALRRPYQSQGSPRSQSCLSVNSYLAAAASRSKGADARGSDGPRHSCSGFWLHRILPPASELWSWASILPSVMRSWQPSALYQSSWTRSGLHELHRSQVAIGVRGQRAWSRFLGNGKQQSRSLRDHATEITKEEARRTRVLLHGQRTPGQ